jgi:phosphatidylglycerol---prolipoprotein diacylglyceryl transferase
MCLAVSIVFLVGWMGIVGRGLPRWRSAVVALAVAVSFPAGARSLDWLLARKSGGAAGLDTLLRPEFSRFALPGGMLLALLTSVVLCLMLKVSWWRVADGLAPGVYLGAAVLRAGCFLNGCCFGVETSLPWGVVFPMGSPAHIHQAAGCFEALFREPLPVHPTQLYELSAALAALTVSVVLLRRNVSDGTPAMAAMTCFLSLRWTIHHLRAVALPPGFIGDAFYGIAVLAAVACLLTRWRMEPSRKPDPLRP